MDKKLKTKWLKALRSGKYRQGKDVLKAGRNYCCLGVLAEIQGCAWKAGVPLIDGKQASPDGEENITLLPRFAGRLRGKTQSHLANMNDGAGGVEKHSFRQIADYIEKKF